MNTILIAEDEKFIRRGLKTMIERSPTPTGEIREARDGEEALETNLGCLILDILHSPSILLYRCKTKLRCLFFDIFESHTTLLYCSQTNLGCLCFNVLKSTPILLYCHQTDFLCLLFYIL